LFGDNQAVVNNSANPHSCPSNCYNVFSFHWVFDAIAARLLNFFWVNGKDNPADIVSNYFSICCNPFSSTQRDTKELGKENNISKSGQDWNDRIKKGEKEVPKEEL
jgi:hypothetical protein